MFRQALVGAAAKYVNPAWDQGNRLMDLAIALEHPLDARDLRQRHFVKHPLGGAGNHARFKDEAAERSGTVADLSHIGIRQDAARGERAERKLAQRARILLQLAIVLATALATVATYVAVSGLNAGDRFALPAVNEESVASEDKGAGSGATEKALASSVAARQAIHRKMERGATLTTENRDDDMALIT
jgi:hypothetical protein